MAQMPMQVGLQLVERFPAVAVRRQALACGGELRRECDDLLLYAVVQVPLDASAFGVAGLGDAGAGGGQLLGLASDEFEPGGQFDAEVALVYRARGLGGELGEQAPVLL